VRVEAWFAMAAAFSSEPPFFTVIEWLTTRPSAKAEARRLWAENAEHEVFSFDDSGIDGIQVEEISS
jgi:hypothetical protein